MVNTRPQVPTPTDRPHAARRAAWALATLVALLAAAPAPAADVAIVRASDADPYRQAEVALVERLTAHRHATRTLLLKTVADGGVAATLGSPDAVVAIGTPAARWLYANLPDRARLVYCMVTGPADAGLLGARPAWGVTTDLAVADQLKLIGEALPAARVVGTLYRSDAAEGRAALAALRAALPEGWRVQAVAVNDDTSVADAIEALTRAAPDVIWTTPDAKLYDTAAVRALLLSAVRARVPVWGFSPAFVRAGALLGVGVDPAAQGAQAADLVAPALAAAGGGAGATGRVEAPREFQVAVNLIVARQVGVTLPESLVRRAAHVYRPEK